MPSKIEISHRTIIFIILLLMSIWLVVQIKDILFLLFISYIIMSAIRPFVEFLEGYKIPRLLSIIVMYILLLGFLGFALGTMIPVLVSQTNRFVTQFPKYLDLVSPYYQIDASSLSSQLAPIGENIIRFTIEVFSNIVTTMTVLVFTFYLLLEYSRILRYVRSLFDKNTGNQIVGVISSVETNLGSWLRGELFLMICVGTLTYIGLTFLSVDYALPLAIIAGLLEIIPVIGPIISGVPAVLVAFPVSSFLALATAALYFLIQQLENNLIVPVVMKRAVGLSPLIVIISLMIGSQLAGPLGAVLSIPIVVMLRSVIVAVMSSKRTSQPHKPDSV